MNDSVFKVFPELETSRLVLRQFVRADSKDIYEIRSNRDVMEYMDMDPLKSIEGAEKLVVSVIDDFTSKKAITWAITQKENDDLIGYVSFWRLINEHYRTEIGYALSSEYWRNGFMKEALTESIKFAFEKSGLHSIERNVNPKNLLSIKVLEKLEFKKEAYFKENFFHNGKFLDSVIYSLLEVNFNK